MEMKPRLIQITENKFEIKVNAIDNASLDISTRRLWNSCEKTFFYIRIRHPTSQSYFDQSLSPTTWKRYFEDYSQRAIDIVVFSFNPLVFTSGRMAPECAKVERRLAEKMQGALCTCHDLH